MSVASKKRVSQEEMIAEATKICERGVQYVLLSLGREGAILITKDESIRAIISEVKLSMPLAQVTQWLQE